MSVFRNVLYSVITLFLFGWGLSALYYAQIDFATIVKTNPEPPWTIEFNALPIFATILIGTIFASITYPKLKRKRKTWKRVLLLPTEFEEGDEREKELTAKACRASYISMWYAFPILASLLLLYPFISDILPYYPIILFLLFPFVQIVVYFISWKRNY